MTSMIIFSKIHYQKRKIYYSKLHVNFIEESLPFSIETNKYVFFLDYTNFREMMQ